MLNVSFKTEDNLGFVTYHDNKYFIQDYNGLFSIINFYYKYGVRYAELFDFANSTDHLERCLKEYGNRYNSWYLNINKPKAIKIARSLLKFKVGFTISEILESN